MAPHARNPILLEPNRSKNKLRNPNEPPSLPLSVVTAFSGTCVSPNSI